MKFKTAIISVLLLSSSSIFTEEINLNSALMG
jgi:hypothetical protein